MPTYHRIKGDEAEGTFVVVIGQAKGKPHANIRRIERVSDGAEYASAFPPDMPVPEALALAGEQSAQNNVGLVIQMEGSVPWDDGWGPLAD